MFDENYKLPPVIIDYLKRPNGYIRCVVDRTVDPYIRTQEFMENPDRSDATPNPNYIGLND